MPYIQIRIEWDKYRVLSLHFSAVVEVVVLFCVRNWMELRHMLGACGKQGKQYKQNKHVPSTLQNEYFKTTVYYH